MNIDPNLIKKPNVTEYRMDNNTVTDNPSQGYQGGPIPGGNSTPTLNQGFSMNAAKMFGSPAANTIGITEYDKQQMSSTDLKTLQNIAEQYKNDPNNQIQYAAAMNNMRANYGYTMGSDGSTYTPTPGNMPTIPQIDPYSSNYEDLINDALSAIQNYGEFEYGPANDASFQAFVQRATQMGQTAFNNQLGALSANTGGRANSWAVSAASQANNQYLQSINQAAPAYEQMAYARWQDGRKMLIEEMQIILDLDDRDFQRYQFNVGQKWQQFDAEFNLYQAAIQERKDQIAEAYDRTRMLGYVTNEDAELLGVEPGTPSFEVREREAEQQQWLEREKIKLENAKKLAQEEAIIEKELIDYKMEKEKEMMDYANSIAPSSSGRSGSYSTKARSGGGGGGGGSSSTPKNDKNPYGYETWGSNGYPKGSEYTDRDNFTRAYDTLVSSKNFKNASKKGKYNLIKGVLDKYTSEFNGSRMSEWAYKMALRHIKYGSNTYQTYYANWERGLDEIKEAVKPKDPSDFTKLPYSNNSSSTKKKSKPKDISHKESQIYDMFYP